MNEPRDPDEPVWYLAAPEPGDEPPAPLVVEPNVRVIPPDPEMLPHKIRRVWTDRDADYEALVAELAASSGRTVDEVLVELARAGREFNRILCGDTGGRVVGPDHTDRAPHVTPERRAQRIRNKRARKARRRGR